jgi:hypothetical protein
MISIVSYGILFQDPEWIVELDGKTDSHAPMVAGGMTIITWGWLLYYLYSWEARLEWSKERNTTQNYKLWEYLLSWTIVFLLTIALGGILTSKAIGDRDWVQTFNEIYGSDLEGNEGGRLFFG